ncbi:TPA: hypothetical protein N0F65_012289 [Lagenidium giganteum]|uniref:Uncharacterized protein n=1 Tax=Lagenidium giganteum TaxID=4803 RepID=A0AAV2ZBB1_9STRA|nr:TPA: hypothetical protein N0F65_012289 [Lagenidium giganteum]
MLEWVEPC